MDKFGVNCMGIWQEVYPLGRSFGLIKGSPDVACEALVRELTRSLSSADASVSILASFQGPNEAIAQLEPFSLPLENRFVILECPQGWSLYLDNSALFDASPPRLADLARVQKHATIYVTSVFPDIPDPNPIHQIFVFRETGGLARAVSSQFDNGIWRFFEEGLPYPFEKQALYSQQSYVNKQFTRQDLRWFLSNLGVAVSEDNLLILDDNAQGYLLEIRDPKRIADLEYFTLEELRHTLSNEEPSR